MGRYRRDRAGELNIFAALGAVVLACAPVIVAGAPTFAHSLRSELRLGQQQSVDELLAQVGERVVEFYNRATSVICIETSTVQPIDSSYSPQGFTRTVESELRIEIDKGQSPGPGAVARSAKVDEASVVRKVLNVNGRPPRDEDKKGRAGCTDPNPLSSEPLAFLLPSHRGDYHFRIAGTTKESDRNAVMIDFSSANRRSRPELIEDPRGRENCFDWLGHIASKGRIWVDEETHDVLRVERSLVGPVDVKVPAPIQRRYHIDSWVVIVRDDVTIRYKTIAFSDPDEVLLLPASIDTVTVIRGGLQSTRRTQAFSDYRRFVTSGKVVP